MMTAKMAPKPTVATPSLDRSAGGCAGSSHDEEPTPIRDAVSVADCQDASGDKSAKAVAELLADKESG